MQNENHYDYSRSRLLDAVSKTELTDTEFRTLESLAANDQRTVNNIVSILQKIRQSGHDCPTQDQPTLATHIAKIFAESFQDIGVIRSVIKHESILESKLAQRQILAKKIAKILAESRTKCGELDAVFECVRQCLTVTEID